MIPQSTLANPAPSWLMLPTQCGVETGSAVALRRPCRPRSCRRRPHAALTNRPAITGRADPADLQRDGPTAEPLQHRTLMPQPPLHVRPQRLLADDRAPRKEQPGHTRAFALVQHLGPNGRVSVRQQPVRPLRRDRLGVSYTSVCRSHDVTEFSAPTGSSCRIDEPRRAPQHPAAHVQLDPMAQYAHAGDVHPVPGLDDEPQVEPVREVHHALVLDVLPARLVRHAVVDPAA